MKTFLWSYADQVGRLRHSVLNEAHSLALFPHDDVRRFIATAKIDQLLAVGDLKAEVRRVRDIHVGLDTALKLTRSSPSISNKTRSTRNA